MSTSSKLSRLFPVLLRRSGSNTYIFYDDYSDTRAAGSVNGTVATPPSGTGISGTVAQTTRTVVDTESKLSVASGVLNFAGGKASPAHGDPSLWYGAITRAVGRLFVFSTTNPNAGTFRDGFGTAQSGTVSGSGFTVSGTSLYIRDSTSDLVVGTIAGATRYTYAVCLRAAGAAHFIKGGAFTNWTLLFVSRNNSTTTLYPGFGDLDSTKKPDNARVATRTFPQLLRPIASDSFTRANGVLGLTDGLGVPAAESGGGGLTWEFDSGVATIASNLAVITPTLGAEQASGNLVVGTWYSITATTANYFYTGCAVGDTFIATATTALDASNKVKAIGLPSEFASITTPTQNNIVDVKCNALTSKTQIGVVARMDSIITPANFIIAYFAGDGANVKIDECVSGSYTNLGSYAKAFTANDTLRLDVSGTAFRLYHITNAGVYTLLGSGTTNVTTGVQSGLFSTNSANKFSGFNVYAKGTGNEYTLLDGV